MIILRSTERLTSFQLNVFFLRPVCEPMSKWLSGLLKTVQFYVRKSYDACAVCLPVSLAVYQWALTKQANWPDTEREGHTRGCLEFVAPISLFTSGRDTSTRTGGTQLHFPKGLFVLVREFAVIVKTGVIWKAKVTAVNWEYWAHYSDLIKLSCLMGWLALLKLLLLFSSRFRS
jgi:hypothetical protein